MIKINPETQKTRRERLATVIAIALSAFFHIFVFVGGIQLYRWAEEEEKKEQLMVIQRIQESSPDPVRASQPAPRRRAAPAEASVKEEGQEPPPDADTTPSEALPSDLPAEGSVETEEAEEITETTLLVRTDLRLATFSIKGPLEFHGSGTSLLRQKIPPGDYTATFHPVAGYRTPPLVTKTLAESGRIVLTGRYTKSIEVKVTLNRVPGASFEILRPDGKKLPMNTPGSALFDNLPKGDYTIVFRDVPGFLTPAPQTRTLGAGGNSLNYAGSYLPGESGKKRPVKKMAVLDKRVQMVVKSYPPTSIEENFDYILYPGIIFTKRNFQQGWCRVYLVAKVDGNGRVYEISIERPGPEERGRFKELIEAVRKSVNRWRFDKTSAEVHVDVRFYVE
jgi:hypothetical protein